jgi:hypothetical protein
MGLTGQAAFILDQHAAKSVACRPRFLPLHSADFISAIFLINLHPKPQTLHLKP